MDPESYLALLTSRLADGVARLPEATRVRHAAYLRAAQNADGGFSGREGGSDLYYTAFGLRGLSVLDALTPEICERAAGFLRHSLTQSASVVDFFSLLYACLLVQASGGPDVLADSPDDWPERTAAVLETFRTADGGYTKTPGGASGSTYHTFLVGLCYQLLGKSLPNPAEVVRFTASRRREDGGFVEIAPMRRGGTNPTAAAVGLLQLTAPHGDALMAEVRDGVVDFLAEMASPEGGLRANGRAPWRTCCPRSRRRGRCTSSGRWTASTARRCGRSRSRRSGRTAASAAASGMRGGMWSIRSMGWGCWGCFLQLKVTELEASVSLAMFQSAHPDLTVRATVAAEILLVVRTQSIRVAARAGRNRLIPAMAAGLAFVEYCRPSWFAGLLEAESTNTPSTRFAWNCETCTYTPIEQAKEPARELTAGRTRKPP